MMRAQYNLLFFVAFFLLAPPASHAVPQLTSVSGKLTDVTGNPITGSFDFIFRIYSVESGGTALWTEYWNSTNGQVTLNSGGYFSALLGSHTALNLPFDQQYWLSIQVANDLLSPRFKMGSVPYTYRANITENLAAGTKATGTLNMNNYDITGAGGIYGTTLYEGGTALSSKYALQSTTISPGSGLSGGGDLSAARTLSIANGGVTNVMIAANSVNKTQVAGVLDSTVVGSLDAANITSGTIASARVSGVYSGITGLGTQAQNLNMGGYNVTGYNYIAVNDSSKLNGQAASYYLDTSSTAQTKSGSLTVTGAWLNATNLNVSTNGYFGGNVGIGTASPGAKLDVNGGIIMENNNILALRGTGIAASTIAFQNGSGTQKSAIGSYYNIADEGDIEFINGASTNMVLRSFGNVGIGTTAPNEKLEANGAIRSTLNGINWLSGNGANFDFYQGQGRIGVYNTSYTGTFGIYTGTLAGAALFINSNGNVGIGTTSPGTKLSFGSSVPNVPLIVAVYEPNAAGIGMDSATAGVRIAGDSSGGAQPVVDMGYYAGSIATHANWRSKMVVSSNGNVGIGTTSPSSKLEVAGTLNATSGGSSILLDANGDLKIGV